MSQYRLSPQPDQQGHAIAVGYERMLDSYFGRVTDPSGPWSQHTTTQVEAALMLRGFRIVTRAEAAQALRAAGYRLGTNRAYGHAIYADQADSTTWWEDDSTHHAFAIADLTAVVVVVSL